MKWVASVLLIKRKLKVHDVPFACEHKSAYAHVSVFAIVFVLPVNAPHLTLTRPSQGTINFWSVQEFFSEVHLSSLGSTGSLGAFYCETGSHVVPGDGFSHLVWFGQVETLSLFPLGENLT